MIVFAATACRLFRDRPAVHHLLWLVVLLKFVTPPIVAWPWSVQEVGQLLWPVTAFDAQSLRSHSEERRDAALNYAFDETDARHATGSLRFLLGASTADLATSEKLLVAVAVAQAYIRRAALPLVMGIWLVGAAICAMRQLRRIARHAWLVRWAAPAPEQLMHEVNAIARQVGLRPPRVLIAPGILSPFVWFLGRLRLVWPVSLSGRQDIIRSRGVMAHELAHVRRRDHWVAWLELVAGLIWWWNPLFWFVRSRIRESAEMACDAIALSLCPDNRRTYAELLLELSAGPNNGALAPVLGVSASAPSSFERRLSMILSERVVGKVSMSGYVMVGWLALVALPGWSLAQEHPNQDVGVEGAVDARPEILVLLSEPLRDPNLEITESAPQADKTASPADSTVARLEKLEAELRKLSQLVEKSHRPVVVRAGDLPARVSAEAVIRADNATTPIVIKGIERTYVISSVQKRAFLTALTNEGREIWVSSFRASSPIRGSGVTWTLDEAKNMPPVILTWMRDNESVTFYFERNTGQVLTAQQAERMVSHNVYAAGVGPRGVGSGQTTRTVPAELAQRTSVPVEVDRALRVPAQLDSAPSPNITAIPVETTIADAVTITRIAEAGGRADSLDGRLRALEQAVEELRRRLGESASARGSSTNPELRYEKR
jgi:beta-lactamase regulating signal transducer with metallopeptidase domain